MGKVTKKDFLRSFEGLNSEEKAFMEKNADIMCEIVNKAMEGFLSPDDAELKFKAISDKLTTVSTEKSELSAKVDELKGIVKSLSEAYEKAKSQGVDINTANKFIEKFEAMMDSSKLKNFINGTEKSTGFFPMTSVKEIGSITSVTDNLDTPVHLSRQTNILANPFTGPKLALRDIIKVIPGDAEHPNFTFLKVKKFDRNAQYETENGRLKQSSLELEEVTVKPRRLGSYFDLSKDLLLARLQLRAWLVAMIPGIIAQAENASILFGDGKNNTLKGIALEEGVTSIEDQLTKSIVDGEGVKSIKEHKRGVLVELSEPASLALDSMMITFKGAKVNTDLATPHPLVKINDRQLIVLNVEYKGEETEETMTEMTYNVNHCSFKAIEDPNSKDVISAIFACLSFAQYSPNAIVLNPITVFLISTEKDALGRSLDLVQKVNGVNYIGGIPVIESTVMPVGEYLAGDFQNGAVLFDYTKLEIAFAEDAETVLYNMIRLWFQEQLGLVTVMPWAFAKGNLNALREALSKDSDAQGDDALGLSIEGEGQSSFKGE